MTKISPKKVIILLAGVFFIGATGAILYESSRNRTVEESMTTSTTTSTEIEGKIKQDTNTTEESATTTVPPATGTPTGANLQSLAASVTATKSVTDETISAAFYLERGTYTVQEKINGSWNNILENYAYPGSGGLTVGELKPADSVKSFRILKNENGNYIAASKEFSISREDVVSAGGIKTYN